MIIKIPSTYTMSKFYSYSSRVTQNRTYLNGTCPICKEGKSFSKKTRLFYFIDDDYFYCHNCSRSWTPYFWIKEASGMSFKEIMKDIKEYTGYDSAQYEEVGGTITDERSFQLPDLPGECVNLKDKLQLEYYKSHYIVKNALDYCKRRRLFTAINAPKNIYVCIQDKYHKNRLIIPYYNEKGKIICYISRKLLDSDPRAKYLLKFNSDKPLFNLHKVDYDYPYIFIFEGAIDASFVKNGVAISGISMTEDQAHSLNTQFPFHQKIWVFDNYRGEAKEVLERIQAKIKEGEKVFMYGDEFTEDKDLNEHCIRKNLDSVNPDLIANGCAKGLEALLLLGKSS